MPNYFYVNRSLLQSDRWLAEPFTRGQAWVDLFGLAHHEKREIRVNGVLIIVPRGHVAYSQLSLAKRWKWSRVKVAAQMKQWVYHNDITIVKTRATNYCLIKVMKYDYWQGQKTTDDTTDRTTDDTTDRTQSKNDKNVKNEKNINNMRQETKTLYEWINSRCSELGIENKTKAKTLDVYVVRYLGKIQFRPTLDHYFAWMIDNNKRVLHSSAVGNAFERKQIYNKAQEMKLKDWDLAKKDPYVRAQLKGQTDPRVKNAEHFISSQDSI